MAILTASLIAAAVALVASATHTGVELNDTKSSNDYKLADGTIFNANKGWQIGGKSKQRNFNGWEIPGEDIASLTKGEINSIVSKTQTDGPLDKQTFLEYVGGSSGAGAKWQWYKAMLDYNYAKGNTEYNSSVYSGGSDTPNVENMKAWEEDPKNKEIISQIQQLKPQGSVDSTTQQYDPKANYYDMLIDPNGEQAKQADQYRESMYSSIDRQETEVDQTLASSELDAYKMLGQNQLQLERQIADQRMRQLRSGTTSAQLAVQELQNMFAGQNAAMGIAQQTMDNRVANAQQFAMQRGQVEPGLQNMINANKTALASVEAQRYAGYMGFQSYDPASILKRLNQDPRLMSQYTEQNNR